MKDGSKLADSYALGYQDGDKAFMHAMSSEELSASKSSDKMEQFVKKYISMFHEKSARSRELLEKGKTKLSKNMLNEAFHALGFGLHPIMDSTSPAHSGFKKWRKRDYHNHGNNAWYNLWGSEEDIDAIRQSRALLNDTVDKMREAMRSHKTK